MLGGRRRAFGGDGGDSGSDSGGRGALGSESENSGLRAARPDTHRRVDVGCESALLHAPKTGRCRRERPHIF